jgi:glycosyltransferase involved in cell wall biosynthesis
MGMTLGVVIPVFIKTNQHETQLIECLQSLRKQSRNPDEIVLTLDTPEWNLTSLLKNFKDLHIKVVRNEQKAGIGSNSNSGLDVISVDIVHVLHQDDFLLDPHIYDNVCNAFLDPKVNWIVLVNEQNGRSEFQKIPNREILLGFNSIGGPSAVIMRKNEIRFRQEFSMLVDVVFFEALFNEFNEPLLISGNLIEYGDGADRQSRVIPKEITRSEITKVIKEFEFSENEILKIIRRRNLNIYHRSFEISAEYL